MQINVNETDMIMISVFLFLLSLESGVDEYEIFFHIGESVGHVFMYLGAGQEGVGELKLFNAISERKRANISRVK